MATTKSEGTLCPDESRGLRKPLLATLDLYSDCRPSDGEHVERIRTFVEEHDDCFLRSCLVGHITASAWIVSADASRFLLAHHKKLGAWLQVGGHADGDSDTAAVALREAKEESGLGDFRFVRSAAGGVVPIDVDIHRIPTLDDVPAHLHYDIRYLLVAQKTGPLRVSDESHDVRWFGNAAALEEESLRRMARRATAILSR